MKLFAHWAKGQRCDECGAKDDGTNHITDVEIVSSSGKQLARMFLCNAHFRGDKGLVSLIRTY